MPATFSDKGNKALTILIEDCILYGFTEKESMEYIEKRFRSISLSVYYTRKRNIEAGKQADQWLTYYARKGFVEFYRKRITEMEMIQKETFNQWYIETNKPYAQKDKNLIMKLVAELRSNNQQLTSLGMVTPIIASIKNIIDDKKDKVKDKKIV